MRRFFAVLLLVYVASLTAVVAKELTALDFYKFCQEPSTAAPSIGCMAYIRGLLDGMTMGNHLQKRPLTYCLPEQGVPADQGKLIIEKYFRDHPSELQGSAGPIAILAIVQAFPCKPPN